MNGFSKSMPLLGCMLWILFCLVAYAGAVWLYRAPDAPLLMCIVSVMSLILLLLVLLFTEPVVRISWCDFLLIILLLYIGVRRMLSGEPLPFIRYTAWVSCVSVYVFVRFFSFQTGFRCVTLWILRLLSLLEALVVLLQQTGILSSRYAYSVVSGTFDNPAFSACFMALGVTAWLERVRFSSPWYRLFFACLGGVILCTALVLADSRAAWLATGTGVLIVLYSRLQRSKRRLLCVAALLLLLCGGGMLYLYKRPSADGRLLIWYNVLDSLAERLWTGYGPDAFLRQYAMLQADFFQMHPSSRFVMVAGTPSTPFSEPLRVTYAYGLTGLCLIGAIGYIAWRQSSLYVKALLFSWVVFSLFSYPLSIFRMALVVPILVGFLSQRSDSGVSVYIGRWRICLSVFVVAAMCVLCLSFSQWQSITQRTLSGMPLTTSSYEKMKYDESLFLIYYQKADETMRRCMLHDAMELYPSAQIWCDYAGYCASQGDTVSALWWYDRAAKCVPSLLTPPYKLLELAETSGDTLSVIAAANSVIEHLVKVENTQTIRMRARARAILEKWTDSGQASSATTTPDDRSRR